MALSSREILFIVRARDQASRVLSSVASNTAILQGATRRQLAQSRLHTEAEIARSQALTGVGIAFALAGAASIKFFTGSIKASAEYENQSARTLTQVDQIGVKIQDVAAIGMRVGKQIGVPFEELQGSLFDIFSSMNVTLPQSESLLRSFAKEAVAGQVSLQDASRATIGIMNAFQIPAGDVNKVLDFQFQLVRKGVGTFGEFASTIGRATPTTVRAGQSYQTLGGMLAFLTRNGLSTAMAAASAGRALESMVNPKTVERFEAMGIKVKDANGQFRPLVDIVGDLAGKLSALPQPEKVAVLNELFKGAGGTIQARRFWDLAVKNFPQLRDLINQMGDSAGAMDQAFGQMSDTVQYKVQLLKNRFKEFRIEIGDALRPVIKFFLDQLLKIGDFFANLSPQTTRYLAVVGFLGAAFLTLSGIVLTVVGTFGMIRLAMAAMGTSMGLILARTALWTAAFVALMVVGRPVVEWLGRHKVAVYALAAAYIALKWSAWTAQIAAFAGTIRAGLVSALETLRLRAMFVGDAFDAMSVKSALLATARFAILAAGAIGVVNAFRSFSTSGGAVAKSIEDIDKAADHTTIRSYQDEITQLEGKLHDISGVAAVAKGVIGTVLHGENIVADRNRLTKAIDDTKQSMQNAQVASDVLSKEYNISNERVLELAHSYGINFAGSITDAENKFRAMYDAQVNSLPIVDKSKQGIDDQADAANADAEALKAAEQAMRQFVQVNLDATAADANFTIALSELKTQVDAHSRSLDTNTIAGAKNAVALAEITNRALDDADAKAKASGGTLQYTDAVNQNIPRIIEEAKRIGFSKDAIVDWLAKQNLQAPAAKTNTEQTKAAWQDMTKKIGDAVAALKDKDVHIRALADFLNFGQSPPSAGANSGLGAFGFNAFGGKIQGPGGTRQDKIPSMLSNGEYVLQAPAVAALEAHGVNLDGLNNAHKFAFGGAVGAKAVPDIHMNDVPGKINRWYLDSIKRVTDQGNAMMREMMTLVGGGWQGVTEYLDRMHEPYTITSTTGGGHVQGSLHYQGRAVDLVSGNMMHLFLTLARIGPKLAELFYDPAGRYIKNGRWIPGAIGGHSDHVHAGVFAQAGGFGPGIGLKGGAVRATVEAAARARGWGGMLDSLDYIISHESGWNPSAKNPSSTASGLFQLLYGGGGSLGSQIQNGFAYISGRYGNPDRAAAFWRSHHWYKYGGPVKIMDSGGLLQPGWSQVYNGTGRAEELRPNDNSRTVTQHITIHTNEIDPTKHAADLGFRLAARTG